MANKENLVVSVETASDSELKQRFDNIVKEIGEIGGADKSKDKILLEEGSLNGQFANYLLKNRDAFNKLKDDVKKFKSVWSSAGARAGEGLDKLDSFFDDIENQGRMEKDYEEFMKKIKKPKKLNKMKSWEIRRLNLYLGMNEDKALFAYIEMKKICGKYGEYGMKSEDIAFFESVWNTIKNNYKNSDSFLREDYPAILTLQPTVASLRGLAGENWDGKSESIIVPEVENSIVDSSIVTDKAREINKKRIDSNREKVKNIAISVDDLSKFTKKDSVLKYDGQEFTVEKMMELFGDKIKEAASQGTEFLNDAERDSMIDECKGDIFTKLKTDLLSKVQEEDDSDEDDEDEQKPENLEYESPIEDIKIKNPALKNKIIGLKFCENLDSSPVKFNINEVKNYLVTLKDKEWAQLEKTGRLDRETWTIAVQISLMYLKKRDGKDNYSVRWIDGMRGPETVKGVKGFQEAYGLKFKNNQPDGLPGKVTIGKLLDVLGSSEFVPDDGSDSSDSGSDSSDSGSDSSDGGDSSDSGSDSSDGGEK